MKNIVTIVIVTVILITMVITLPTSIGLGDSGLLAAAAANWGVPHPPGFPTYVLLGHLFALIPMSTLAWRLGLLSVIASVGTIIVIYFFVEKYTNQLRKNLGRMSMILAFATILFLAFSYSFWSQAVNVETYALTNFFIIFISYLALEQKPKWWFVGVMLGLGLGLSPTVIVVIPALFYKSYRQLASYTLYIIAGIVVIVLYSYLPLAAVRHPFLNWSDPSTTTRFIKHVSGGGLSIASSMVVNGFTGSLAIYADAWIRFGYLMLINTLGIGTILAVIGAIILFKMNRTACMYWLFIIVSNVSFAGLYISGNRDSWFITSLIVLIMFMGITLQTIHDRYKNTVYDIGIFFITVIPFFLWFPRMWQRAHVDISGQYITDLYRDLPQDAVLLGGGETFNALTVYAHESSKIHADRSPSALSNIQQQTNVIPIDFTMYYGQAWYRNNLQMTDLGTPSSKLFQTQKSESVAMPNFSDELEFTRILEQFADANSEKPIFVTGYLLTQPVYGNTISPAYIPQTYELELHGIVYRLIKKDASSSASENRLSIEIQPPNSSALNARLFFESNYRKAINLIQLEYGLAAEKQGDYFLRRGTFNDAFLWYRKATEVAPLFFDQNRLSQKVEMLNTTSPSAITNEIPSAN